MKLSEISTERAADVLCELTPLVDSIITDEDLMQSFSAVVSRDFSKKSSEIFALYFPYNSKSSAEIPARSATVVMGSIIASCPI